MTAVVDDPLIAGMVIRRVLPLHESSRRLRTLYPECPRVYGVAVMSDVSKRRWWPLEAALTSGRLDAMFADAAEEMDSPAAAAQQLAATLAHTVIGRVVALVVLEGRAWDTGLENLWVHVDSEGAIDWLGVVDPTLRVLPGRSLRRRGRRGRGGGAAWRGGARDLGGAPVPPRAGAAVRPTARGQRRRGQRGDDVAHRGFCHRRGGHSGTSAGRLERGRRHAPRAGGARRAGRIRVAGAWPVQPARTGPESSSGESH